LAKEKINVDIILQSIGRDESKDISFTTTKENLAKAIDLLKVNQAYIGFKNIETDENIVKVSVVGSGMASNPGVAAKVFEALYDAHINIHMISTSEIKISVLIDAEDGERAMRAIHDRFELNN
jgi:aspartate kinase